MRDDKMDNRPAPAGGGGKEYGVVANVWGSDRTLRKGAKVWIVAGWAGGGWERLKVHGLSRSGRKITKWVPITRLANFRRAWMPEALRTLGLFVFEAADADDLAKHLETISRGNNTCFH